MNKAIIILGMHRSGTSCLTGCLSDSGLNLGSVSESNKHNKKGNQENKEVFKLNESLLNFNHGGWKNPPLKPLTWNKELEIERNIVLSYYNELPKPWGIKDPRMLLTYNFWENHLPQHQLIGTIRHPVAVAQSLLARKHKNLSMPVEQAYHLWKIYNEALIYIHKQKKFPIINFDLNHTTYLKKINKIRNDFDMNTESEIDFFDNHLVNQNCYSRDECPQNLLPLYDKLLDACI